MYHNTLYNVHLSPAPTRAPYNLTLVEVGSTYALLQWLPPLEQYHNGIIDHYLVNLKGENASETILNLTTTGPQLSVYIASLQPNSEYSCSVAAVTVSPGPLSGNVFFTTEPDGTYVRALLVDPN